LSKARKSGPSTSPSPVDLALIGFDTATEDTAVCAKRGGEILYESLLGLSADGSPGHATRLLEEVERAADAAGGWEAVEGIAVGLGPGSFTGLRIGIATAQALAASTGLPLNGVGTLDAVALGLAEKYGTERDRLAVLDARRGEAFASRHSAAGPVWGPWVGSPAELGSLLSEQPDAPLAAGSGALRFRNELVDRGVEVPPDDDPVHRVAARHLCALAAAGEPADGALAPIYLRPPDAERWRERDNPQKTG
jgi:tRNA threonylcarbamoyladenosine biosynthesis protein TsaB